MHEILRLRLADDNRGLSFIAVRKHMMIARSAAACALVRNDRLESTLRSDWVRSFRKAGGGGADSCPASRLEVRAPVHRGGASRKV